MSNSYEKSIIEGEGQIIRPHEVCNCVNHGTISNGTVIGGIIGWIDMGNVEVTISDCQNDGEIAYVEKAAGVIGDIYGEGGVLNISGCSNKSDLCAMDDGGIVAYISSRAGEIQINDCNNSGMISTSKSYSGGILGHYFCAGDDNNSSLIIANCSNDGEIDTLQAAGGILGCAEGHRTKRTKTALLKIINCKNNGKIDTKENNTILGGMVGMYGLQLVEAKFSGCENHGILECPQLQNGDTGTGSVMTIANICGGIVGRVGDSLFISTSYDTKENDFINGEDPLLLIENCFSDGTYTAEVGEVKSGDATTAIFIGGIIGNCSGEKDYSLAVVNCSYTNADRGMGDWTLPDVGSR